MGQIKTAEFNLPEDISKKEIKEKVEADVEARLEEGSSVLEEYVFLKRLTDYLEGYLKGIQPEALRELQEKGGEAQLQGAKMTVSRTGDIYNYEASPIFAQHKKRLDDLKEQLKVISKQGSKSVVDEETGEILEPVPLKKASQEIIKVSL